MKNSEYWINRANALEQSCNDLADGLLNRKIRNNYKYALKSIDEKINYWYNRIADNNNISIADAKKLLNKKELADFKMTLAEYIEKGRENALNQKWLKQLENASARVHIERLQALQIEVQQQVENALSGFDDAMQLELLHVYEESYCRTIYTIQNGIGVYSNFATLDKNTIKNVLSRPWAVDETVFSDKIWTNKTKLINTLNKELVNMFMTGESPAKTIKKISNVMDASRSNIERLVYTESAYFHNKGSLDGYAETGVDEYEFVCGLDKVTCERCARLDGTHYGTTDAEVGVNYPPMHPRCRCTTVPYFDDDFAETYRSSRNKQGKTVYKFKDNVTYTEWRKKVNEEN